MKELIFEILILAVIAGVTIWRKTGAIKIDKPKETENGKFAIPKPEDEFMEGIENYKISTNIKIKQNENNNDYISNSNISDSSSTNS